MTWNSVIERLLISHSTFDNQLDEKESGSVDDLIISPFNYFIICLLTVIYAFNPLSKFMCEFDCITIFIYSPTGCKHRQLIVSYT